MFSRGQAKCSGYNIQIAIEVSNEVAHRMETDIQTSNGELQNSVEKGAQSPIPTNLKKTKGTNTQNCRGALKAFFNST